MTKLRIYSDIHDEQFREGHFEIPEGEFDDEAYLILAGDIATNHEYLRQLEIDSNKRFKNTLRVSGNHESYGHTLHLTQLEPYVREFEDVVFICATLWTDFKGNSPTAKVEIEWSLNDYNTIRVDDKNGRRPRKLVPRDVYVLHQNHKNFIDINLKKYQGGDKKIVVVTHHVPLEEFIDPKYGNTNVNFAFVCTDMLDIVIDNRIDVWISGHDHSVRDVVRHETRFISNCVGYLRHEETGYTHGYFEI